MLIEKTSFLQLVAPPVLEWQHYGPHVFIGGLMANITCSPADPLFFMHHAFIDLIWEEFRQTQQTRRQQETQYPSTVSSSIHGAQHLMAPFEPLKNIEGLGLYYTDHGYRYSPRLEACRTNSECGRYLFCHQGLCMSKINHNGNCTGLLEGLSDPCECGICVRGKCTVTSISQTRQCEN